MMDRISVPSNCSLDADNVFGPVVPLGCRNGFDFTLLFEQSILGILPAAVFLLASPLRVGYLIKKDARTQRNSPRFVKLAVTLTFALIQLALLVCWTRHDLPRTKASVPSASINLIVAMELLVLSWLEDGRSAIPSSLLTAYLLLTLLFDIVQARTLWLRLPETMLLSVLFTISVGSKMVMLLLESLEKRQYLTDTYRDLPPESTSGIINRSFMWWLNHMFTVGSRRLLTIDDMYSLDQALNSATVSERAQRVWARRRIPARRFEFPWKLCQALWKPLLMAVFPRMCLIGFTFAQPFLIAALLDWLGSGQSTERGHGLIAATPLVYLGLAISTLHSNHFLYRFITMFRGAASSLVYEHMLYIPDGKLEDRSAAITRMTTDIDRIAACLVQLHECWARIIEVAIGIFLLTLRLGWVSAIPVIIVIFSCLACTYISKNIGNSQKIWVDAVQQRLAIITSMLTDIQVVKRMGLSRAFTDTIQKKRVSETQQMSSFRWHIVWQNMIQNLPWALAPALTFTVFAVQGHSLDFTKTFTSLSIITLLTNPAAKLLSAIPSTAASLGCFDRIQSFLLIPAENNLLQDSQEIMMANNACTESMPEAAEQTPSLIVNPTTTDSLVVAFENASIRPDPEGRVLLNQINLQVPRGAILTIRGPVGSGKSTLLRAILGQVVCETGSVSLTTRRIAYCAQRTWLPTTTIRNAICAIVTTEKESSRSIDHEWYGTVLRACALDEDLHLIPEGDDMQIGSGLGARLSGGQMDRVALARAVYARKDLVILDDVLSALDTNTKSLILERLFGERGVFRKLNSTVILVTHDTASLAYADKTLVISNDSLEVDDCGDIISPEPPDHDTIDTPRGSKENNILMPKEDAAQIAKDNQLSDLKRSTGDYQVYKYYLRSIGWSSSLLFLLFVILNVFCSTFSQIWLERWTSRGGEQRALYVTVYIMLALLEVICMGGYVWAILILISPSTARKLHYVVLKTVMGASPTTLATMDSGALLNRFSQDMTLIESQLPVGLLVTVSNLFTAIAAAALIATGSTWMAITVPFLIAAVFVVQHYYLKTSRQLRLLDLESRSPLYSHYMDTMNGLSTIQAFGWQKRFSEKSSKLLDVSQRPYYLLYCIQRWLALVLDLIVAAEAVLLVSLAVNLRATTSIGLLGVSLNNILSFNQSLSSLITGWTQLEISLGSIARTKDFERDTQPEETLKNDSVPASWPDRGAIEFKAVTAQYNPTAPILKDVSFKVRPGQKIGICGRTGSGKSSLLGTILGMLDLTSGSILIDDVDLTSVSRETVRERLVTIAQDPLILAGCTVRLNADPTPGNSHPDAEIIAALDRVGLWHGVLAERSGGLDAELGADTLSRGQTQLLGIARAMLQLQRGGAKVLLLDEATSHVDPETEARVQALLREEPFRSCSVLAVAHRVESIRDYDRVVVLERGRVVDVVPGN
ncbi:putative ATP-binding cassette transporter [Aspergillus fijiensis CBS 313.89]|uniref:Putative ATP-binding cassette transporter n=1 Tax=Aspergillus fijiensis CBS 313.89 TaxID=1448319 RepID=A0A8G1RND4_9EURO|nr:putative ATP-binding cassette transporter [Aspergillus fijiensis CBS 313.89]RAK73686.1 putative ATP-binding cassette transporter [Aspergillus fijiensis CBS 313.89]